MIDRLDRLDAALSLAARGFPVFPLHYPLDGHCSCGNPSCPSPAKHPRTAHGLKDATTLLPKVYGFWQECPAANIARLTGFLDTAVDVDRDAGGDDALRALEAQHGPLPPTWRALTGRGFHVLFQHVPGLRNSAGLLGPGLDIRGEGGYVVAPGSTHINGREYMWELGSGPDDVPLAPMPAWIIELLRKPRGTGDATEDEEWVRRLSGVPLGQQNNTATQIAGRLASKGLSAGEISEILLGYGARCTPPISREDAATFRDIAKRIWEKEQAKRGQAEPDAPPIPDGWGYKLDRGAMVREHEVRDREGDVRQIRTPLANFDAWIALDETLDDGSGDLLHVFHVCGRVAAPEGGAIALPTLEVPAGRFDPLNWVAEGWGARVIIYAAPGTQRHHLALAIRTRTTPDYRHVYTHTGYIETGAGESLYLSSTGAVGHPGYEVDLGHDLNLRRYALPPSPERPAEGMKASLALLQVAPPEITVPLLGAVWRAPLASQAPCDFSIWLVGATGARKSSLAAVVLSHYGDFPTKLTLPLAWSSTSASLEQSTFRLKDALVVVDDYAPDKIDPRELIGKAQRLIRSLGNASGRGRLGRDLSERPPRPPRGLVIATGESFPPGESIAARALILHMAKDTVAIEALTTAQLPTSRTATAQGLSAYVEWLGEQFGNNGFEARLAKELGDLRRQAQRATQHPRVPEIIASLQLGWIYGLAFAVQIGALSEPESTAHKRRAWEALLRVGEAQGSLVEERQPVRVFLEILGALLEQRRAVLLPIDTRPEAVEFRGREILGWHDKDFLYLIPKVTFREIGRYCRDVGESFPVPEDQIDRILVEHGVAVAKPADSTEAGRLRVRCGGEQRRVMKLDRAAIVKILGPFDVPTLQTNDQKTDSYSPYREPGDESQPRW